MLVLSRKPGESLTVEKDGKLLAKITITRISGDRVSIGMEAPSDVGLNRFEVYERQQAERSAAAVQSNT